jgi:hypothetical protein
LFEDGNPSLRKPRHLGQRLSEPQEAREFRLFKLTVQFADELVLVVGSLHPSPSSIAPLDKEPASQINPSLIQSQVVKVTAPSWLDLISVGLWHVFGQNALILGGI